MFPRTEAVCLQDGLRRTRKNTQKGAADVGRIIAVANQKGGVGKTTTAINLSASLAILGYRVLLIDLDPQANSTSGLGLNADEPTPSLYEVLLGEAQARETILATKVPGLELLASAPRLFGAEVELVPIKDRESVLSKHIHPLAAGYNYLLIDCPPSLGLLTINGLTAAHSVLVPMQCEYYSLEGLSHLIQAVRLIQESLNPSLRIEGVLLTMYDGRLSLSQQVAEEARRFFGERIFATMIPRNVRLGEAPSFGKPVALYDPQCAGAVSYMNLAKEIAQHGTESTWKGVAGSHP
jgi:chromosome partitioning protein